MAENPFEVSVVNPLQALLLGQQSYDTSRKSNLRGQASQMYKDGNSTGALQTLLDGGDFEAIKGLQLGESIKRSEAERAAGSEFSTGISSLLGLGGLPIAQPTQAAPVPNMQPTNGRPMAPQQVPTATPPQDSQRAPVASSPRVWGDAEAEAAGIYEPKTRVASLQPETLPNTSISPGPRGEPVRVAQGASPQAPLAQAQPQGQPQPAASGGAYQIRPDQVPFLAKAAANPMLPAADRDLAKTLLMRALDQSKPNEKMQYLQQLKESSGFQGTPLELEMQLRRASKTDVTTNIDQKTETEENKAAGKAAGERRATMFASAGAASKTLQNLSRTESLLNQVSQGKLEPARMNISGWAKALGMNDDVATSLGLDPAGIGSAQALQSLVNESVVGKIGAGGFPANNFSDADREFITDIFPKLSNDPRGNKIMIEGARRMAQLDMDRAKDYQKFKADPANKGKGFEDFELAFSDKIAKQDLFGDLRKQAETIVGAPRTDIGSTYNNPGAAPAQSQQPATTRTRQGVNWSVQ